MTVNRRDFIRKSATLSGIGLFSALSPTLHAQSTAAAIPSTTTTLPKPALLPDAKAVPSKLGLDSRIWTWHRDATTNDSMPANYYEATLPAWDSFPALQGDQVCDVVVIGGGLLGASTALHLSQAGLDVVLLEKHNVGSGASGRNGGQLTPGLARWEAETMMENLPPEEAQRLWRFASIEAMNLIDELSDRYGFECDRKREHLTAAVHPGHMGALVSSADARRALGDRAVKIMGPQELKEYVQSDIYHGAALDTIGGQVQPLALLRGMVYGLVQNGGKIHENSAVTEIIEEADGTRVVTEHGAVKARKAVVLGVHYAAPQFLENGGTTIPFYTYVAVTPSLPMDISQLLPGDLPVYDTQLQIDYYRAVRNNRLLFGGQGTGNSWSPRDVNNYLLQRIQTVFPQWEKPELEYSWGGISDITLNGAVDSRKSTAKAPVYAVHGWSGHGVAQTVRIGKSISDDITGRNDDFAMLTRIPHDEIPFNDYIGPVAIPLVKGALTVQSLINPADMVSF